LLFVRLSFSIVLFFFVRFCLKFDCVFCSVKSQKSEVSSHKYFSSEPSEQIKGIRMQQVQVQTLSPAKPANHRSSKINSKLLPNNKIFDNIPQININTIQTATATPTTTTTTAASSANSNCFISSRNRRFPFKMRVKVGKRLLIRRRRSKRDVFPQPQ